MLKSRMLYVVSFALLLAGGYFGWRVTSRDAYESAKYEVLEVSGAYEVRQYPMLMMATTDMQFEAQGEDGSFMRLFQFISGENDTNEKVAMTTPVFMEPDSGRSVGRMGFVLPEQVANRRVPSPKNPSVDISERPAGRYAVHRFAGRMSVSERMKAEEALREWMSSQDLVGGEAEFAGYDPPWAPGPCRRNEVLIPID